MDRKKQLGRNITLLRRSRRFTQKALAEKINKSSSYLCDIEKGRTLPSLKLLYGIADVLGYDITDFFKKE